MRLEKINDNQIRVTLTLEDLSDRKIQLNELAYGSEKARNLFFDMMEQAHMQFGFQSNGAPLMIEAIPTPNSLILNITKVNDPEELDTRFSSFSPSSASTGLKPHFSGADGVLNLLKKITGIDSTSSEKPRIAPKDAGTKEKTAAPKPESAGSDGLIEAFRFSTLDNVIMASKAVDPNSTCVNSLYKYDSNIYLLILHSRTEKPERFNKICNVLSEYGTSDHCSEVTEMYLREHNCLMIADDAIRKLAQL